MVEMERSEEQFVKEMKVTRRNGEPALQVTTMVWSLEDGFVGVERFKGFVVFCFQTDTTNS